VFEKSALRRIFGPNGDEVTEKLRKLHSEELHNLHSSANISRQIKKYEVGEACGLHGRGQRSVHCFGGKAGRKETTQTEAQMG
jgi:hypothetical protein